MPNANTITMEGIILWTQNKTSDYLRKLPAEEREHLMDLARQKTPEILKAYRARKENIKQHYRDMQLEKQRQQNQKIIHEAELKDRIAKTVMAEGGPCKSKEALDERLAVLDPTPYIGIMFLTKSNTTKHCMPFQVLIGVFFFSKQKV